MAEHARAVIVALGVLVMLTLAVLFMAAAPARQALKAYGISDIDPVSGTASWYNMDNLDCAMKAMSCNLFS